MKAKEYKRLDMNKILSKTSTVISMRDSLKDVTPIRWNNEVLCGKKRVVVK